MIDHISHSQLQMLFKCGIQYQFRYVDGLIIPPSASLVRGKCGHKTLEKNFIQKIETKEDMPIEAVQDIFSDEWEQNQYGIAWTEKDLNGESPKKAAGRFKDTGIELVKTFHKQESPLIYPVYVEDKFEIAFQQDVPKLVGIIDRIDEGDEIGEVKFVSKSPNKDDILQDIQLTIYDLGYRQKYGRTPKRLKKRWAVSLKEPKIVQQDAEPRDDNTITRLLWRIQSSLNALKQGVFLPAPQGAWWCSENWCGFWNRCKHRP